MRRERYSVRSACWVLLCMDSERGSRKDALADPVDLRENNAEKPAGKQRLTRRSTGNQP
mgnify:FL=1